MRPSLFLFPVGGGAIAALGWLREIYRGWQLDRAERRAQDVGHE